MLSAFKTAPLTLVPGAAEAACEHVLLLLPQVKLLEEQLREVGNRIKTLLSAMTEANAGNSMPTCDASLILSIPGVDPDYMKTGPWSTTLYVGDSDSRKSYLIASFKEHGNTFSARWINENLLFVQVWWGRIASSDLILDVTTGRFIYDKLANYGQTVQPCTHEN